MIKTVTIPSRTQHCGLDQVTVRLNWVCPVCQGERGEPFDTLSYDGSLRMTVHGWVNPCGHVDLYSDAYAEAVTNGLNTKEQE